MKWLITLMVLTAIAAAQTPFPSLPSTSIGGSDPPQNPAYTCPYNGQADACMFQWTSNTAGMSRVLVSAGNATQGFYHRWIDNLTSTTSHQVVVDDLLPGTLYFFGFANCAGNTLPTCGQFSASWSSWNCAGQASCNAWGNTAGGWPANTPGSVTIPTAPVASFPIWNIRANGPNRVYVGHFLNIALLPWVTQRTSDGANITGYTDLFIAPITGGVPGTYVQCTVPTTYGSGANSGYYSGGGACGSLNINAYMMQGGNSGSVNIQYPFRPFLLVSATFIDPALRGKAQWSGGNNTLDLGTSSSSGAGTQAFTGGTGNLNMQVAIMPQVGTAPGDYSVQMIFHTIKRGAICSSTSTPPGPPCSTNYDGTGGTNRVCSTLAAPVSPMDCFTVTKTIHVLAVPANLTPPAYSSLTKPANMEAYRLSYQDMMRKDMAQDCDYLNLWNYKGGYHNTGFGYNAYANNRNPVAIGMYDGTRSRFEIHDYLRDNITNDWAATTAYSVGDIIRHNNIYYANMNAGTSGASLPGFGGSNDIYVEGQITDGSVIWVNIGSLSRWNDCANQIQQPYLNWLLFSLVSPNGTLEPNEYIPGRLMTLYRQGDQQPQHCFTDGTCTGLNRKAIDRAGTLGGGTSGLIGYGTLASSTPYGTIRIQPYGLDAATYEYMVSHTKQPFYDTSIDATINQGEFMLAYTPYDQNAAGTLGEYTNNPNDVVCCLVVPTFDFGLATEALIQADLVYYAETSALNPIIEPEVARFNNSQWSRFPGPPGFDNYSWPYSPFSMPQGRPNQVNSAINPLSFPAIAWQWRMEGNSCSLTNNAGTQDTCISVLETLATHSSDCHRGLVTGDSNCPGGSSTVSGGSYMKENNQTFKWWDWWGWRAGTLSPLASYIDSAHNPQEALFADTVPPYYAAQSQIRVPLPSVTTVSGTTTFVWYTYQQLTALQVGISTAPNNSSTAPTIYACSGGGTSVFDPTKSDNTWRNTCAVSALANGTYYWSPQGTNSTNNNTGGTPSANVYPTNPAPASFQAQYLWAPNGYPWYNMTVCGGTGPCAAYDVNSSPPAAWATFTIPPPAAGSFQFTGTITGPAACIPTTLTLDGARYQQITTSTTTYSITGLVNGSYVITPSAPNCTFTWNGAPSSGNLAAGGSQTLIAGGNLVINFTSTSTAAGTFSISGTVSGAISNGVSIALGGASSATTTTNSSGAYTFSSLAAGSYTLTPSLTGYSFSPTSLSPTISTANITGQNFTSTALPPPTFTISGTVIGVVTSGVSVTLGGIASPITVVTDSNGNYSFANLSNATYLVTPQLTGFVFDPPSSTITVSGANMSQNFLSSSPAVPPAATWDINKIGPQLK